ncbi:MAG: flagellar biosynthetic protein FliR [Deltaproteobacteria bacterium]|nr:MAG: flagellar biosynthetic protein FliR [Deltaproteobacteria bacterium]
MPLIIQFLNLSLASLRIGGFLAASPIFSLASVPTQVRVILAFGIGLAMSHHLPALPTSYWEQPGMILLIITKEIGLGLIIGFTMRMIFLVTTWAMELSGLQIGFNMANVIDPANNNQASILAQLSVVIMVIFVFASNLHHEIIWGIFKSYQHIPMGPMDWNFSAFFGRMMLFLKVATEMGIRMSFPIMIAMLVFHIIMGIVAKAAPQLNIFLTSHLSSISSLVLLY